MGIIALGARIRRSSRKSVISKVPQGVGVLSIPEMIVAIRWARCAPRVGIPSRMIDEEP